MIELQWWYWLVAGIVLLAADIVVIGTFYLMWLGLACVLVSFLLLLFPSLPLVAQAALWGAFTLVLLGCWVSFGKKMLGAKIAFRPEKMIGVNGVVTEWHDGSGKIRFQRPYGGDDVWNASCAAGSFAIGASAKVAAIDADKRQVTIAAINPGEPT